MVRRTDNIFSPNIVPKPGKMKLIILSCLIAVSLGLPAIPEPQGKGIKEDIANAASNLAENYNSIKNEVQNQISQLPQQISENVITPIQQAVGPITENQDSYHITLVVPKPHLPSWFPSNLGSLNDYLPNFLKPRSRSLGYFANGQQIARNIYLDGSLDDYSGEEQQQDAYIIIFALPNALTSWLQNTPWSNPATNANEPRL